MTDQEILTKFESLVDDSLDQDLEIQLANTAKNRLERELKLLIHQKQDSSSSVTAGQTYTTGTNLPSDFRTPITLYLGTTRLNPAPFKDSVAYRNNSSRYWIDARQSKVFFGGTQASAQTINLTYLYKTDDITSASVSADATTVTWPSEFHDLIAYEMAKVFYEIDQPSKERSWKDEWNVEYNLLKNALISWDHDLKLAELGGQTPYGDDDQGENPNTLNF